ncbi:NepR family anti-sigma factor, partial [Rhizobiaceae sp. 2RAB30]
YYRSLLSDDVPDHLTQLLARLERAETEQKKG